LAVVGIDPLDKTLEENLPRGFLILVTGTAGSGTEMLAKQFAANAGDEKVLYVSTMERESTILKTMEKYGWKADMKVLDIASLHYDTVLKKELEISTYRQEGISVSDVKNLVLRHVKKINFMTLSLYEISKMTPPFRVVIDSLDFYFQHYGHENVISMLTTVRAHVQHNACIALVTMLKEAYPVEVHRVIEGLSDCIIELDIKYSEKGSEHYLTLRKVLNHPDKTGIYRCMIGADGISIWSGISR